MIKRLIIFFVIVLTLFSSVYSVTTDVEIQLTTNVMDIRIEDYLNGRTPSDLVIEITNLMANENFSTNYQFNLEDGLKITFANKQYVEENFENESTIYGGYDIPSNTMVMNIENLYEDITIGNWNDELLKLKIFNTFQHEITHYLFFTGRLADITETLNISIDESNNVLNLNHFFSKYDDSGILMIPYDLHNTLNFQKIFIIDVAYPPEQYYTEIMARIMAVCMIEDYDYTYYWDILNYNQDYYFDSENISYTYCANYEFHPSIDNNYNEIYKQFILSYAYFTNPELFTGLVEIESISVETFSTLDLISENFIIILIFLTPLMIIGLAITFIIGLQVGLVNFINSIINKIFKK